MPQPLEVRKALFIERAKKVHAGENLDYSQVEYVDNRTPVKIIDPEFGEFWQAPTNHLNGQKHPKRKGSSIAKKKRMSQEEVIRRFKEVHKGEKLDYSRVKYVNMHTKVEIICHELRPDGTEYGSFWQEPVVHLKGCSHPELAIDKATQRMSLTQEEFIEKCRQIHPNDNYSYEKVRYVNYRMKVDIVCHQCNKKGVEHGVFSISAENFLAGKGCPKCGNSISIMEDEIYSFLRDNIGLTDIVKRDRSILNHGELDLFVPSHNIAIEYDGLRWHSERFKGDHNYHYNKSQECEEKGIKLIHIFEDEYLFSKSIVLKKLAHIFGCNKGRRIRASKCVVREITSKESEVFLNINHLQGGCNATIHLGLFYNDELVGVQLFRKRTKNRDEWELVRFAVDNSLLVMGAGGKLFKYFIETYQPSSIMSFLDRRWSWSLNTENLYTKLGFVIDGVLQPDYRYTNGHGKRIHKFACRKKILSKRHGFPLTMTEREMTEKLGLHRIYDCGLIRYIYRPDTNKS